jgi:F-type H+-transporting ATPase subunit a
VAGPLKQFEVKPLVDISFNIAGYDIYFTNSALFMMLAVLVSVVFVRLGMGKKSLIPGRMQSMVEMTHDMVAGLMKENIGDEGKKYFPFIFSLFVFVLFGNLLGMIPYAFTFTSHIIVTFALAFFIFVTVTIIAFAKHGTHFFRFFLPEGIPFYIIPIFVPIEIISYFTRPISLSVRLFANMLAGHTLMKVMAIFTISMGALGILPLLFNTVMIGFEIFVALLQAYIFTLLSCLYLNDALHMH